MKKFCLSKNGWKNDPAASVVMITLKPVLPSDPEKAALDRINRATFPDYERAELDEL